MGPFRLSLGVVGILLVFLVSILPPVDDPGTAFDETDTPINIGTPVLTSAPLLKPPVQPRAVAGGSQRDSIAWIDQRVAPPVSRESRALLDLLQQLLC